MGNTYTNKGAGEVLVLIIQVSNRGSEKIFYSFCGPDCLSPLNSFIGNYFSFHFSFLMKSHILCPKWLEGIMGFMHINTALLFKKGRICSRTIYILGSFELYILHAQKIIHYEHISWCTPS